MEDGKKRLCAIFDPRFSILALPPLLICLLLDRV
jgi:hypothetical protein